MNGPESLVSTASMRHLPNEATQPRQRLRDVLPYAATILAGAFLLFQSQLIISKYILPWFGGAPAVWTTCNLVFQLLLLLGYIYAHFLVTRLPLASQVKTHLFLIGLSLLMLSVLAFLWPSPITAGSNWKPEDTTQPVWNIVSLLTISIGFPFFVLATTSPLLQKWFTQSQGRSPYRLFALSNAGSLLGLLSYPFIIEPNLSLFRQSWLWSAGYLVYILLSALCALRMSRAGRQPAGLHEYQHFSAPPVTEEIRPGAGIHLLWLSLSACGCAIYLATTNMICQEIAVIPFLWVLPLSLYLLTFIACFDSNRWYRRVVFHPLYAIVPLLFFLTKKSDVLPQIGSYPIALLVICMICHGELARIKPSGRYLTSFYLMIACGGAAGGIFVALIAPLIFPAFWEFQIAIWACGILLAIVLFRDRSSWFYQGSFWPLLFLMLTAGELIETCINYVPTISHLIYRAVAWGIWGIAVIPVIWLIFKHRKSPSRFRWTQAYAIGILVLMGAVSFMQLRSQASGSFIRFRSFFGAFRILKNGTCLTLKHGTTNHGWQFQDGTYDSTPTSYYTNNSGIGILLWDHPKRSLTGPDAEMRVGVVGLGAGTLAAYGRSGDYYCFYEIDPAVVRISQGEKATFTYLKNSPSNIKVVLGDARLSMERQAMLGDLQKFDILVLDAFNSDSIPVHLMTREAMQIYLKHLRNQDSVIAFHISNRVLDLVPVLRGLSREFNLSLKLVDTEDQDTRAYWGLLSYNPYSLQSWRLDRFVVEPQEGNASALWTDDNNNLFRLIRKGAWW
jgi:hypothetical protein